MLYARYKNENSGYPSDIEKCKRLLTFGEYYEVTDVSMGQSHTDIKLKGFDEYFNSVNFEFYTKNEHGKFTIKDIYKDPKYNPYIRRYRND